MRELNLMEYVLLILAPFITGFFYSFFLIRVEVNRSLVLKVPQLCKIRESVHIYVTRRALRWNPPYDTYFASPPSMCNLEGLWMYNKKINTQDEFLWYNAVFGLIVQLLQCCNRTGFYSFDICTFTLSADNAVWWESLCWMSGRKGLRSATRCWNLWVFKIILIPYMFS